MKCDHEVSVVRTKKASSYQSQTWHYIRRHIYDRAQQLIREIFHRVQINVLTLCCYPLPTSKAGFAYFWPKIKVHFPNYFTALLGLKKLRRQRQERMISLRNRAFAEEHKKCNTELCSLKRIERTQLQAARRWNIKSENGFRASSAAENALWPIPLWLPRAGKPVAEKYFAFRTNIFQNIFLKKYL